MTFSSHLVEQDGEKNLTVFVPGRDPLVAHESHPNFEKILEGVRAGDEAVLDLFNIAETASNYLEPLSERISRRGNAIYLDGDQIDNALTQQIIRFLDAGEDDWIPLVNFFEKVQQNPQQHSREQLFRFLTANNFSYTPDGDIIAYKGVRTEEDGSFVSGHTGTAAVDGVVHTGHIPNPIGAIITMPRNQVAGNPTQACSAGLHVATHSFASSYGTVLEVHVNPRDIVSVPNDSAEKIRCCRYVVVGVKDEPYEAIVVEVSTDDAATDAPTESEWNQVTSEAKSRKKGIAAIAGKYGWTLVGDDPKNREDWSTLPADLDSPDPTTWDGYVQEGKDRKKGVASIAKKYGYVLVGSDPKNRLHYTFQSDED